MELINGRRASTEKLKTTVFDTFGASSQSMINHANPFINKNPKMLIIHVGTKNITNDISTIKNFAKICNYVKYHAKEIFLKVYSQVGIKGMVGKVKILNLQIANFFKVSP